MRYPPTEPLIPLGGLLPWLLLTVAIAGGASLVRADVLTGTFVVRDAVIGHTEQNYLLSAQVDVPVDDAVRDALRQGLPLKLEVEVEVARPRRFWPDASLADTTEHYELSYHAVTDRYRVDKGENDSRTNGERPTASDAATFPDLESALVYLGRVDHLPIVARAAVDDARRYNVDVRATVSVGDLPATLKLLMFWRQDWKRSTEWYTWPLSQ